MAFADFLSFKDFLQNNPLRLPGKQKQANDIGEIKIILRCILTISYSRLPRLENYFSKIKYFGKIICNVFQLNR